MANSIYLLIPKPTLGRQCHQVNETAEDIRNAFSVIVLPFTLNVYHCKVRPG